MGILSNFIGGAAQAGGEILQKQRESDVDLAKQKSFADYASALDLKKQQEVMAMQQKYQIESEGRGDARTIEGEKRGLLNQAASRKAIFDEAVSNATQAREIKVEDAKAVKKVEYDPDIQALMRKAENEKLTASVA